jgi:predicted dienelactone hydrolase
VGHSSLYELARDATQDHVESIDYALAKKSYKDARIKAAFLMAPAHGTSFSSKGLSSIHIPIFIAALEGDTMTPLQQNAAHYGRHIKGAEIKVFKGDLSHSAFRNGVQKSKVQCVDAFEFQVDNPDGVLRLHQETLNLALNFFKNTL